MRSFLDTNVLVYLFDGNEPAKKARAQALLKQEVAAGTAILSTQVLQEFYVAATRKLARPLATSVAEQAVREFARLPIVQVDTQLVLAAIGSSLRSRVSFWDALIVQAAVAANAERLLTEDMQHGQRIDGVRIENPFL